MNVGYQTASSPLQLRLTSIHQVIRDVLVSLEADGM